MKIFISYSFISSFAPHALDMLLMMAQLIQVRNIIHGIIDQLDYDDTYDTDDFASAMHFRGFIWGLLTYQDYYDIPYDTTRVDLRELYWLY